MKRLHKHILRGGLFAAILMIGSAVRHASGTDLPEGWLKDWKAATEQAKTTHKPILAVFSAEWCGPCQQMVKEVYPKAAVKEALKDWVPVYIDEAADPKTLEKFDIEVFPTFVLLSADGKEEDRLQGGRPEKTFVKLLKEHPKYTAQMIEIEAGLKTHPEDGALWKRKAEALLLKDKIMEATEAYAKAVEFDPEDKNEVADDLYFYKALPKNESQLKSSQEKLAAFEGKFPKSPLIARSILFRAYLVADEQKLSEAKGLLEEGIKRFPESDQVEEMKQALKDMQEFEKEHALETSAPAKTE